MDDTAATPDRPAQPLHPRAPLPHLVPLLRATALEAAFLGGHLPLYPSGLLPERRPGALHADAARRTAPDAALPSLPRSSSRPVVLLHGFVDNRSAFVLLRRSLARSGHRRIEPLNHSPPTCGIRVAAGLLGRHVEDLLARTGQGRGGRGQR